MSVQLDGRRPDRLVETSGRPAGGRVQAAIETSALTKAYGATVAVDRLDLRVEPGQVFGFLGPHGAGSTVAVVATLTATGAFQRLDVR